MIMSSSSVGDPTGVRAAGITWSSPSRVTSMMAAPVGTHRKQADKENIVNHATQDPAGALRAVLVEVPS